MPITSTFSTATPRAYGYGIGGSAPTPPSAATDAQWNYVTALLHGTTEGSTSGNIFTDASTNNFTVTPSATPNTLQSAFTPFTVAGSNQSWSNLFNGSSYLTTGAAQYPVPSSGAFSVECFVYLTSVGASQTFYSQASGSDSGRFNCLINSSNKLEFGHGTGATVTGTTALVQGQWYHVAICRDGSNNLRLFVNGILETTSASYTQAMQQEVASIGAYASGSNYFNGYISNLRVTSTALYTATTAPPSSPLTSVTGTTLLTCQANYFKDSNTATTAKTISIAAGTPKVVATYPFDASNSNVTTSAYGSSSTNSATTYYLTAGSNAAYQFGTNDFTVEFWMYCTGFAGSEGRILQYATDGNWASGAWGVNVTSSTAINWVKSGGSYVSNTYTQNAWNHIAIVRSSSSTKVYVNGVGGTASSDTTDYNYAGTYPLSILAGRAGDGTFSGSRFYGNVSNVRIVKGVAVYTGNFTVPTSPLGATQSSGTNIAAITGTSTSLLTLQNNSAADNNTFLDQSPNYFPVTRNGTPTQGTFSPFAPSNESWSQYYGSASNAGTQYLYNGTPIIAQGTAYTIEGWFYVTIAATGNSNSTGGLNIGCTSANSSSTGNGHLWGIGSTAFYFQNNASTGSYNTISWTPTLNQWFHLAFVTTNGTNYTLYINGTSVGTFTDSGSWYNDSAFSFYLGSGNGNGLYCPNGLYMSNVRYTKKAVYTGAFTVPTSPLQVTQSAGTNIAAISSGECTLLTAQSNRYVDNGSLSLVASIPFPGTYSIQRFQPFLNYTPYSQAAVGGSGYFDGVDDYLTAPANAAFEVISSTTTDFTIECWVYRTVGSVDQFLLSTFLFDSAYTGWGLTITSSNTLQFFCYGASNTPQLLVSTGTVGVNQWVHVAVSRASGTTRLYINGVNDGTRTTAFTASSGSTLVMGVRPTYSDADYTGYISNARIIKGAAVYQTNFTPPTGPVSSYPYAGNSLLLNFSNAGVYDNGMVGDYTTVGDAKTKYVSGVGNPFSASGYAMAFDGTGDYLTVPSNAKNFAFGTGPFTVEAWVYPNGTQSNYAAVAATLTGNNDAQWTFTFYSSAGTNYMRFQSYNTVDLTTSAGATAGQWNHVAAVRDSSGNIAIFINGTRRANAASNTHDFSATNAMTVGIELASNVAFNGYMSNLRISKYARYDPTASSITQPTAAFPDIGATAPSTGYQVFNSSGAFTVPAGVSTLYYGIVGGGGSGGNHNGGGGGAGGLLSGSLAVTAGQTYAVIVGGGGAYLAAGTLGQGFSGSNSSVLGLIAYGGGGGGGYINSSGKDGLNGGSGGGASSYGGTTVGNVGSAISGQGSAGGAAQASGFSGGGGGGANAAGSAGTGTAGGAGGSGLSITLNGTAFGTFAGGGGGADGDGSGGAGGSSIGGAGTGATGNGGNAVVNTGSGGGGCGDANSYHGGNGSSGIVILKW